MRIPTERVGVPGGAGARLERDTGAADACGLRGLEERVHAHGAGKIFGRPTAGRL